MNWNQLLGNLNPKLLRDILADFNLGMTNDVPLMKKTIISYLKRNGIEEEKKLIEYLRPPKILSYEMSLILQSHGLSKPTDRSLYFDYIVNQLEPVERYEKESVTLNKEEVTSVSLDEIVTEEEAGPEYTEDDEK